MKPVGYRNVVSIKEGMLSFKGCCIKEVSLIKAAFMMKIMLLINKNGTSSLNDFFLIKELYAPFGIIRSGGFVRANRNPEIKKNNGMWKL